MDPPAAAESTKNPATETINKHFPATTETRKKPKTETITNVFCDTETIKKPTTETIKKTLDVVDDGNHEKNVLTVSVTN